MSSSVNILKNMVSFDKAEQFDGYSKVIVIVSDEIEYSAGTDTGRTLTLNCPWGTQEIANNILQSIKGFQYQPMTAGSALVDPSVEIGDGISANGVYSGVYSLETKFNSNLPTTVSAQADEELYEEHTYVPKSEREVTRKFLEFQSQFRIQAGQISAEVEERKKEDGLIRATLNVQAEAIEARVTKEGGNNSSFGWKLTATKWSVYGNGTEKFRVDKNGAYVNGEIRATTGKIGGFDIKSNYLSYNGQTWGGTNRTGIYVGTNGIQCGSTSNGVRITNSGAIYAETGHFHGTVYAGKISHGEDNGGYFSGEGISGGSIYGNRLVANTVDTNYTSSGINTSLGYADTANKIFNGLAWAGNILTGQMSVSGTLTVGGHSVGRKSMGVMTSSGKTATIYYWGY